ncbi:hypothetical protein HEB94_005054 [Actinopolymorpha pittospori]|uniref:Uncharacterized protein n=1 Tax=Actinopolymorpha pittospori TaxID=648752 RepID=A0A927RKF4_9ACTN|nr:hypothetical protein [Actinopolymorpha pittospori]
MPEPFWGQAQHHRRHAARRLARRLTALVVPVFAPPSAAVLAALRSVGGSGRDRFNEAVRADVARRGS